MAKRRDTMPDLPTDRPIQWRKDLDREGRKSFGEHYEKTLSTMATNVGPAAEKLYAAADRAEARGKQESAASSRKSADRLMAAAPGLKDKPVTMAGAVSERVKHFKNGMIRSHEEGVDSGVGWYFGHHGAISGSVQRHGGDLNDAIDAAAVMSPQNDPNSERAAIDARLARNAGHPYSEKDMKKSGTDKQGVRGDEILSGDRLLMAQGGVPPEGVNASYGPKIKTYADTTKKAVPGTDVENEYMQRGAHVKAVLNGQQMRGQEYLDLYGLKESREGILDPEGNTAGDSWMNAVSTRQQMAPLKSGPGRGVSPAKAVADADFVLKEGGKAAGYPGEANVGRRELVHSWNNEADIRAANKIGNMVGMVDSQGRSTVPSVTAQEVVWHEGRRVAGADSAYNAHVERQAQLNKPPKPKTDKQGQIPGQRSMF